MIKSYRKKLKEKTRKKISYKSKKHAKSFGTI